VRVRAGTDTTKLAASMAHQFATGVDHVELDCIGAAAINVAVKALATLPKLEVPVWTAMLWSQTEIDGAERTSIVMVVIAAPPPPPPAPWPPPLSC